MCLPVEELRRLRRAVGVGVEHAVFRIRIRALARELDRRLDGRLRLRVDVRRARPPSASPLASSQFL